MSIPGWAIDMLEAATRAYEKLVAMTKDEDEPSRIVDIMLARLPYREDKRIALQLTFLILMHDDLAEALNGRL